MMQMATCKMPDCENEVEPHLLICRDCMMGRDVSEKPMNGVLEMPPKRNKQYPPPVACRKCGLAVGFTREDGTEVKFYPSRPDECIQCINEAKGNGRQKKRNWAPVEPINEQAADLAQNVYPFAQEESTPTVTAEIAFPYTCEIHGPHAGYYNSGQLFTKHCKQCADRKRFDGNAAHNQRMAQMAKVIKTYPFLMTYLEEVAAMDGNDSPYDAMAQIVAESIPPEWFKAWALRGVN